MTTAAEYTLLTRIKEAYHERGFWGLFKEVYYVLADVFYDFKFNIKTQNIFDKTDYEEPHADSIEYVGARYVQLIDVFKKAPIDYANSTLLDLGCGKGRAIAVAATHPFKKIIGVEYDEKLQAFGQRNMDKMRFRTVKDIETHHCDATRYNILDDVNVFYFFNPFIGETLRKVVENIHNSYLRAPRKIHIIYLNQVDFDLLIKDQSWLRKTETLATIDTVSGGLYETK